MSRPLKFRAWVPPMGGDKKGEMIDGVQPLFADPQVPSRTGKPFCMAPQDFNIIQNSPRGAQGKRFWYEIEVDAIMQFTGLKDKEGKEVYEGDVIEFDLDEMGISIGDVRWSERGFWTSGDEDELLADELHELSGRVIGNIYSDPHLLTPQEGLDPNQEGKK